jgi:uncharacterized protein
MKNMGFLSSTLIVVFLTLIGAYVAFAAILYLFQARFLYFPEREMVSTPHDARLPFEAIYFKTADNVELYGWFVPKQNARGVVLFCHGNAGNISHRIEYLQLFNKLGYSTFLFDYRGYGKSEGKPSEMGTYLDAQGAWNYLVDKRVICPEDIVIYGESLGGAVGAWLAKERRPAALILASSFTSIPDVAANIYPLFPVRWLAKFHYDTKRFLCEVTCPVLVIHSPDDEIIPYAHGCALFEEAKEPRKFLEIHGDHNSGFMSSEDIYLMGISSFLSEHLPQGIQ